MKSLGRLRTALGERSDYDAVAQCSRCGYCEQACPTYKATGREAQSARGRNQIVRQFLEGKFEDPSSAEEALSTCLLCGACTTACPARVPTPDLVLEARREILGQPEWARRLLRHLLVVRPDLLAKAVRAGFALKRMGLAGLAAKTGLLRLLGLRALAEADAHVKETPERTLAEALREDASLRAGPDAAWSYFAACGTNFVFPRVGLASLRILHRVHGRGAFLDNPCCGLLAFNYGDLETARELARLNIQRWEDRRSDAPVFADCSSCAAFLKSYPQLFLRDPAWRERAEAFAARVKDIVEVEAPVRPGVLPGLVTLHDSCRARHGQGLFKEPRAAVKAAAAAFAEMECSDDCCGGAGLFAFKHPELSEELLRRKIGHAKAAGARTVCASGTSCLIQLARGLEKYYPEGRVVHWSEAVCEALDGSDG